MFFSIVYPCASIKYLHHIFVSSTPAILTNSDSDKLPTFSLCSREKITMNSLSHWHNCPSVTFWFQCTPHEPSTYQWKIVKSPALMICFICNVYFKDINVCLSFPQLSLSQNFTLVVDNETAVWTSGLTCIVRNCSCARVRSNCIANSGCSSSLLSSSRITIRLSFAEHTFVFISCSGHSLISVSKCCTISTINLPGIDSKSKCCPKYLNTCPCGIFPPVNCSLFAI